tara:strand:- start:3925 stop:4311 length:387 start_codon:yes stop_codon:yes gene_type:complete
MILSPWFWLGILILVAGAGATGYAKGSRHAQDAARAAHATALESAIKDANERAQIDAQALIDHERARQEVRTVYVDKVRTITETINANPTGCMVPTDYRLQLNAAINAANHSAAPVNGKLPAPSAPSK